MAEVLFKGGGIMLMFAFIFWRVINNFLLDFFVLTCSNFNFNFSSLIFLKVEEEYYIDEK